MSDLGLVPRGLLIGLAIAAPVGPIGLLCIQRTLAQGRMAGLVSGLVPRGLDKGVHLTEGNLHCPQCLFPLFDTYLFDAVAA